MWSFLLGLIPNLFSSIDNVTKAIADAKIVAINAETEQDKINADERVATLQAQRDVLIADASRSNIDMYMRTLIASGPAFILCKIFFYDKVFEGTTNILPTDPLWNVIMVVIGFYFLHSVATLFKK